MKTLLPISNSTVWKIAWEFAIPVMYYLAYGNWHKIAEPSNYPSHNGTG